MLTDTHSHLDHHRFDSDRPAVFQRAAEAGVGRILIPSLSLGSNRTLIDLAHQFSSVRLALGVHPTEANTWNSDSLDQMSSTLSSSKAWVAIGEIGLDYYWDAASHATQYSVLKAQLDVAKVSHLPVVIHCREKGDALEGPCFEDIFTILTEWVTGLPGDHPLKQRPGVLHSFSGSIRNALRAIQLGFWIGVTGPLTWRVDRQELITALPLEKLLLETDAPYLAPVPVRGKRNEPAFVTYIADKIAQCKQITREEAGSATSTNASRLFFWD